MLCTVVDKTLINMFLCTGFVCSGAPLTSFNNRAFPSNGDDFEPSEISESKNPELGLRSSSSHNHTITPGDNVRVELSAEIFKIMQEGHGDWDDYLIAVRGLLLLICSMQFCLLSSGLVSDLVSILGLCSICTNCNTFV